MSAEDFHRRAVAAGAAGRVRESLRLTRKALAADPDPELRARILLHQAYHVAETTSVGEGLGLLDEVERTPGLTRAVRGMVAANRGLVLARVRSPDALAAFGQALALLPVEDADARGTTLLNRGSVHLDHRDLTAARSDFLAALTLGRSAGLDTLTAMSGANLAHTRLLAGDLPGALRELERVAPVLSALSPVLAAKVQANRAEILLAAGLLDEAALDLEAAAATFGREKVPHEQAEAEHQLARVLLARGDHGPAHTVACRATRRFAARGASASAAQARRLALQARLAKGQGIAAVAEEAADVAATLARLGLGAEERSARLLAAEALLRLRRAGDARAQAGDALRLRPGDNTVDRLRVRRVRAGLADADGEPARAERELRAAMRDLQERATQLGSLELRTAVAVHARPIARAGVARAVRAGKPLQVLAWAELTRALSSRLPRVTPSRDPESAAWARELRHLELAGAEAGAGGGVDGDPGAEGDGSRVLELQGLLRRRAWQLEGAEAAPSPAPTARIRAELREAGGVMLALLDLGDTMLAVWLDGARIDMRPLGPVEPVRTVARQLRADLDALAVGSTPPPIRDVAHQSYRAGLRRLVSLLLDPLPELAGDRPLLVCPSATLSLVPWTLLPGLLGRPVTVSATATSWVTRRESCSFTGSPQVAAVSGPDLRHAGAELDAVRAVWPSATVTPSATAAQTLASAEGSDLFHVAAHGLHRPQSPMFSQLRMADGPVFGYELHDLRRVPRHVVLSACELANAESRPGDEQLGMSAALLAGGVGSVVSGVARVDDRTSAEVATAHHRGLRAGLTPAGALAAAVASLDEDAPPAPFVCLGAGW